MTIIVSSVLANKPSMESYLDYISYILNSNYSQLDIKLERSYPNITFNEWWIIVVQTFDFDTLGFVRRVCLMIPVFATHVKNKYYCAGTPCCSIVCVVLYVSTFYHLYDAKVSFYFCQACVKCIETICDWYVSQVIIMVDAECTKMSWYPFPCWLLLCCCCNE